MSQQVRGALADALIVLVFLVLALALGWVAEDAFISFRFARNLANGDGLVFNPGMAKVDGYTNFLWVLLAAGLEASGVPAYVGVHVFTIAAALGVLWAVRRFASEALGLGVDAGRAAMLLLASQPAFAKWATSGMETSAFTLAFFLAATGLAFAEGAALWGAGVAALALAGLRAEGVLWVGVVAGLAAALRRAEGRPVAPMGAVTLATVGPAWTAWYAWRTWYYGSWVPNTVTAKTDLGAAMLVRGLRYDLFFVVLELTPLLVPAALWAARRRLGSARAAWLSALCLAFPVWAAVVGGDYMFLFRFLVPSLPFMALAGAAALADGLAERPWRAGLALASALVVGMLPAADVTPVPVRLLARLDSNVRGDETAGLVLHQGHFRAPDRAPQDMFSLAMAVRAMTAPGDVVMAYAVGNVPYFNGDRLFLDACGLVTRAIAERDRPVTSFSRAGHERCVAWWRVPPERADVVDVNVLPRVDDAASGARALTEAVEALRERYDAVGLVPDFAVFRADAPDWQVAFGGVRPKEGADRAAAWAAFRAKVDAWRESGMQQPGDPVALPPHGEVELLVAPGAPAVRPDRPRRPGRAEARPNVLFIVWDTVRADHLSLYGHDVPTTPRLEAWAARGVVYDRAVAPGVWTLPSHASMFTGLPVSAHGVGDRRKYLDDDFVTFAEVLQRAGYDTWAWSTNPFLSEKTNLLQGFDRVEAPWQPTWRARARAAQDALRIDEVSLARGDDSWALRHVNGLAADALLDWLDDRRGRKPFLAFLNLMEAHVTRAPALAWREAVMSPEQVALSRQVDSRNHALLRFQAEDRAPDPATLTVLRKVYDAAIREMDDATGDLLDRLEADGVLDHTLVILVADHGELLGEGHQWGHQLAISDELTHVPLVVLPPGGARGERRRDPFSTAEVFRIILETTGVPVPADARAGMDTRRNALGVVSEYTEPMESVLSALRRMAPEGDLSRYNQAWTAVERGGRKRVVGSGGTEGLFDLAGNAVDDPAQRADLDAAIAAWRATFTAYDHAAAAPVLHPIGEGERAQRELQTLGYAD